MLRVAECHPDQRHHARGLCRSCYQADWARRNAGSRRESQRRNRAKPATKARQKAWWDRWYAENRRTYNQRRRDGQLRRLYGISEAEYEALLAAQRGVCALCGKTAPSGKRLDTDHDHSTGRIRGLLCNPCNRAVAILGDQPEDLQRVVAYLTGAIV